MELENEDFYLDKSGNTVFTAKFHLKRGYCCKNKCRHCPWNYKGEEQKNCQFINYYKFTALV